MENVALSIVKFVTSFNFQQNTEFLLKTKQGLIYEFHNNIVCFRSIITEKN